METSFYICICVLCMNQSAHHLTYIYTVIYTRKEMMVFCDLILCMVWNGWWWLCFLDLKTKTSWYNNNYTNIYYIHCRYTNKTSKQFNILFFSIYTSQTIISSVFFLIFKKWYNNDRFHGYVYMWFRFFFRMHHKDAASVVTCIISDIEVRK